MLDEALEDFSDSTFLLNSYGILYYRTGGQYEALRYFDTALECGNEECDTATRCNKGLSLSEAGYYEEAVKIFRELAEREPENPKYVDELAQCGLGRKNAWESILSVAEQLQRTRDEITKGTRTIYEAAFSLDDVFAKVDNPPQGPRRLGDPRGQGLDGTQGRVPQRHSGPVLCGERVRSQHLQSCGGTPQQRVREAG